MDQDLLARMADAHPEWNLVLIGPVVKIDPGALPRRPNIHYLGPRPYEKLPEYIAGWDVAVMPFALNASTRFISPTKTLEYLAAGRPVVSTPIRDVVRPYGDAGIVRIADSTAFIAAVEDTLEEAPTRAAAFRRAATDALVANTSWDRTWAAMAALIASIDPGGREVA
jgi:UDP-galactopyranose mutase